MDWDSFPEAVATAVDRHGQSAWFDGPCAFHGPAGKWVPLGKTIRHDMGLVPKSADMEAGGTLEIRPGKEDEFNAAVAKFPRFPGTNWSKEPIKGYDTPRQFPRLDTSTPSA